ncbi:MAG: phage tail protein [Candidatus Accumulibacter sp. UW25]|jgi:microcystin-dependent protein
MSRNGSGSYVAPVGNPVNAGNLITATWANTFVTDIGNEITNSLPRDGQAGMQGPLTLTSTPPSDPLHAASKAYVDGLLPFASGLPVGAIMAFASALPPTGGFLLCNGQLVKRSDYPALFSVIGTTFGVGDGSTTFAIPDLRNQFIRGRSASRTIGSAEGWANGAHNHTITDLGHTHNTTDPGHTHTITDPGHVHTVSDPGHIHSVSDPGHTHTTSFSPSYGADGSGGDVRVNTVTAKATSSSTTGVSVLSHLTGLSVLSKTTGISNNSKVTGISVSSRVTGVTVNTAGGTESRPVNLAFDFYIKAVNDAPIVSGGSSGGGGAVGGGTDQVFYENDIQVASDYTITTGKNAMSAGPVVINTGVTVTIPLGSNWTIVGQDE